MANKGEWSEVYAFFKLLADGRLYCGDGNLNRYDERWYPILEIFRNDAPDRNTYKIQTAKNNILVTGNSINIEIPQVIFQTEAQNLLNYIKQNIDENVIKEIKDFMSAIDCGGIKAKSTDKSDIRIVIHNLHTGSKPELGYSIKSQLGSPSTLINSNKDGTNFIYRIKHIDDVQMKMVNSLGRFKNKFDFFNSIGASWEYLGVASNVFRNNLVMLDLGMEKIVASCLEKYYLGLAKTLEEATKLVEKENPLKLDLDSFQPMYVYKIKQFLLAFALGMTATTPWFGKFNANGGYIVVKEDGDIICYHFFDRNDLEDYLFHNTVFETPSTTRHKFGNVYKENGEYFIKLNLQVRFVK